MNIKSIDRKPKFGRVSFVFLVNTLVRQRRTYSEKNSGHPFYLREPLKTRFGKKNQAGAADARKAPAGVLPHYEGSGLSICRA